MATQMLLLLRGTLDGLPRLVQAQLMLAGCATQQQHAQQQPLQPLRSGQNNTWLLQPARNVHTSSPLESTSQAEATSSSSGGSSDSRSEKAAMLAERRRQHRYRKRLHAYKAQLPRARKYGPALRELDPVAFEQMRLVCGYYDLPQNRDKPRPPAPSHVTINNMQTLLYTKAVDPYYKLALWSYRSKLQNMELLQGLSKARAFLGQLSAPPDFVPAHLEEVTAAALQQQQQQHEQQQKVVVVQEETQQQQQQPSPPAPETPKEP